MSFPAPLASTSLPDPPVIVMPAGLLPGTDTAPVAPAKLVGELTAATPVRLTELLPSVGKAEYVAACGIFQVLYAAVRLMGVRQQAGPAEVSLRVK